ncbi:uncharacterized protein SPAPADRAFT_59426 [Spathaspora passalidarum NRRL Y-27907]|uniref:Extracellular membrane protein CFEM domain-containing protein n=1 Tax=Spathaspora passalidarum (strain NRRL Y-27907 / 11-Y1) TaxID=619300 RepID=G3AJW3_SPAPN|nr:uncharacterized protein SPAPADRAFT_59426 [Spathaspora passalidarum NRRL Y-27907]EGW34014.1 hypothetical protein SPAPADRAFT_59426 [Spathaspora passalidarum NRRL Y-27907]
MRLLTILATSVVLVSASNDSRYHVLMNLMKREDACSGSCVDIQNTVNKCQPGNSNFETQKVLDCICGLGDTFFKQFSDCLENCNANDDANAQYGGKTDAASLKNMFCNAAAQISSLIADGTIPSGYRGGDGPALGVDLPLETGDFGSDPDGDASVDGNFAVETGDDIGEDSGDSTGIADDEITIEGTTKTSVRSVPTSTEADITKTTSEETASGAVAKSESTSTSDTTSKASASNFVSKSEQTGDSSTSSKTGQTGATQPTSKSESSSNKSSATETSGSESETKNGAQPLGVSLISLLAVALL